MYNSQHMHTKNVHLKIQNFFFTPSGLFRSYLISLLQTIKQKAVSKKKFNSLNSQNLNLSIAIAASFQFSTLNKHVVCKFNEFFIQRSFEPEKKYISSSHKKFCKFSTYFYSLLQNRA